MANYYCKCGDRLTNQLAPNNVQLRVFTDREWDDIINLGMIDSADLPDPKYDVWRCPKCERVYVFEKNRVIKYYVPHSIEELLEELPENNK